MFKVQLTSGKTFDAGSAESLLEAAVRSKLLLRYSCKVGRCSTCKCKVIRGATVATETEAGLSDTEKTAGWILACVRSARSDLVLEAEDLGDMDLPPARLLPCKINTLDEVAPDVMKVVLRLPPNAGFTFIPGQYVDVVGPGGLRRSYSLAGAAGPSEPLELHVRAVANGAMSMYWFNQAKANDVLRINGPLGTFFLRQTAHLHLIFLATGTGLAPVKAILQQIAGLQPERRPQSVTVLWGGRVRSDHYFAVDAMPGCHRYVPVLSGAGQDWPGARGHIQDVLLGLRPDLDNAAVYACGSDAMIHSARDTLVTSGLPATRFYSDAFVCSSSQSQRQSPPI
jgi:CDP-4-dehydro-6-deoxyglucose reductase, E3